MTSETALKNNLKVVAICPVMDPAGRSAICPGGSHDADSSSSMSKDSGRLASR